LVPELLMTAEVALLISEIEEKYMTEENGTGSNLIWAITTIIIVAIIAGALYYSGFLGGTKKEQIDINVDVPATRSN
jgi:hypothetical protein